MTVAALDLECCPGCGSRQLARAFAKEGRRHNSLARLGAEYPKEVDPAFPAAFAQLHWTICQRCSLAFAARRPPGPGSSPWYVALFKVSEERGYDAFPLPVSFVEGKGRAGERLFRLLDEKGLVREGARVLHVRCATGALLKFAQQERNADVWGLDYFPACVAHATGLLGPGRAGQIVEPEPANPFPQKKFDLIISNHMITHSHDPATLVGQYRAWLADGGALVVVNELDHARTLRKASAYPRGINFFHKQLFTERTFISSMRSWGFEPERVRVPGADAAKFEKNMMFICRKSAPMPPAQSDAGAALSMFRGWERRRRIAELFRLSTYFGP